MTHKPKVGRPPMNPEDRAQYQRVGMRKDSYRRIKNTAEENNMMLLDLFDILSRAAPAVVEAFLELQEDKTQV